MNTPGQPGNRSAERLIEIIATGLLNVALSAQSTSAAEYISIPEIEFLESVTIPSMTDEKSRWTCWKDRNLTINYGTGATNHTRYHTFRLPVCPPLYDPTFGFRFTCWRQLAYERRCYVPETVWHRPSVEPPLQEPGRAQIDNGSMMRSEQTNP